MVALGRLLVAAASACALLLALAGIAAAAPADLDRGFAGDGIAEVGGPGGSLPSEAGARMAIGPNDEIFVLYSSYPPCDPPFGCTVELTVARYTADGDLDASFGAGASPQLIVRQDAFSHEFDIAVGPDGKPVVAALDETGGGIFVARLDQTGRLDGTFGVGGRAGHPAPGASEAARGNPAVAVQADGKVVVAAEGNPGQDSSKLHVARYLPNGAFDPGFGSGGETVLTLGTKSLPAGVLIGPDGSVSVPGPLCCVGGTLLFGEGFSVARLLSNGQPDPAWPGGGRLLFPTPGAQAAVEGAALAPDGGLVLAFEVEGSTVSTVGNMVKLLPNGGLDPAFGGGGSIQLYTRVGPATPDDLAVDRTGRVVGVGWNGRIAVFRLRPDGGKDRTFNGGERLVLPFGGSHSGATPYLVGLQSSGRIVVLGESGSKAKTFGLIGLRGGTDRTRCQGRKATVVGTRRADELIGTPRRDTIAALGGHDKVRGLSGADRICGGKGKDTILGGPGRDSVQEQPKKAPVVR